MTNIDWERVQAGLEREKHKMIWRPYGLPEIMNLETSAFHDGQISEPWDVPQKMIVSVAITGAFFQHEQNPNQPITPDEIRESAREVALAGASALHIHVRDDRGYNVLSPRRFHEVIAPLHKEFPTMPIDGCLVPALAGEWATMEAVMESKLLDAAPINATATYIGDSLFVKPAPVIMEKTRLINQHGSKPEIAVYTDADVAIAKRFLISSGLVETPALWLVLPALPGGSPMDNTRQMIEGLTRIVSAIRDVDPEGLIMVCAAGRASSHLATQAALMGLHIRVGMEDTYYKWPHRNDLLASNLEALQLAQKIAEVTGRDIATPEEARALMGLPETHEFNGDGSALVALG
jgi:3-keto-5-aminohexanoate cleavage enzyme